MASGSAFGWKLLSVRDVPSDAQASSLRVKGTERPGGFTGITSDPRGSGPGREPSSNHLIAGFSSVSCLVDQTHSSDAVLVTPYGAKPA